MELLRDADALPRTKAPSRKFYHQRAMQCKDPFTKQLVPVPPIPEHLLAKLERPCRCACGGHRFSDDSDGQGLTARMNGFRSELLQQRMYGFGADDPEMFANPRPGHHASIVFNPSSWTWHEIHVCICPGSGTKTENISGRDRAAGMEE